MPPKITFQGMPSGWKQNLSFPTVFQRPVKSQRSNEEKNASHILKEACFATKKYLDFDLEQFWTILCRLWMVPLKSTEY